MYPTRTVKGRKETNAPIETPIMMKEVNSGGGTRFDALEVTMHSEEDFPVLMADVQNGAAKQGRTIMKNMPKKGSQAKAKQENRRHGEVAKVGRTVPTFAKIVPSGMRRRFPVVEAIAILYWELWPTTMTTGSSPSGPRRSGRSV